jgi:hypothetical protein
MLASGGGDGPKSNERVIVVFYRCCLSLTACLTLKTTLKSMVHRLSSDASAVPSIVHRSTRSRDFFAWRRDFLPSLPSLEASHVRGSLRGICSGDKQEEQRNKKRPEEEIPNNPFS